MTRTFEEMCAERDPVYAAMKPNEDFEIATRLDKMCQDTYRDYFLLKLALKVLKRDRP